MIQMVTDSGVPILVSDSGLRFHKSWSPILKIRSQIRIWSPTVSHRYGYPGLRSWSPIRTPPGMVWYAWYVWNVYGMCDMYGMYVMYVMYVLYVIYVLY